MYHPYFRGKQNELMAIRELADLFAGSNFIPIIEPVKQSLNALQKTLAAINQAGANSIVIANPFHGDHANDSENISAFLTQNCLDYKSISVGILLKEHTTIHEITACCEKHKSHPIALIHAGFTDAKSLTASIGKSEVAKMKHIFFEGLSGKLYQKNFANGSRVLIRDGFQRRRGKDHPEAEFFSDLHATYEDEGMNGFGDFLIVGDDYSEAGGPAYTVAIHLTFIDNDKDDEMHVYHFKSDRQDTPTDPAGKFAEALVKLISKLNSPANKLRETSAIKEFRQFSNSGHFPGLGYLKKLSMKHHIETLSAYFHPK